MSCLSNAADIATIFGLIFAVVIYCLWKNDYKLQEKHEYALNLLKKIKLLHHEIDLIRQSKFYNSKKIKEEIETKYIPQIERKILGSLIEIKCELLVSQENGINNIQEIFNDTIYINIIKHINTSVYEFYLNENLDDSTIDKTKLFAIIFPAEVAEHPIQFEDSSLGTGIQIVNDEFNKTIKNNFESVYKELKKNLI